MILRRLWSWCGLFKSKIRNSNVVISPHLTAAMLKHWDKFADNIVSDNTLLKVLSKRMTPEQFILQEEGESGKRQDGSYEAVWDKIGGVWTIGPGLTEGVKRGTVWESAEVEARFHKELEGFEATVKGAVKKPLNPNQYAALVSFCYNIGDFGFLKSSVLSLVNKGMFSAVPNHLALYVHGRGVKGVVPGLVNRRAAEIKLWNTPIGSEPPPVMNVAQMPVPKATMYASHSAIPPLSDILGWALANVVVITTDLGGAITDGVSMVTTSSNLPNPTVLMPATQTPLFIGQLGTFLRGVAKILGGGLIGVVAANINQIQDLANHTNFWLGAFIALIAQLLSQYTVSQSNATTLQVTHDLTQQVASLSAAPPAHTG